MVRCFKYIFDYSKGQRGGRGGGHRGNNQQWCNEGQNQFKPKSDYDKFQNHDYEGNSGRGGSGYQRGGGRGGGRGGNNRY